MNPAVWAAGGAVVAAILAATITGFVSWRTSRKMTDLERRKLNGADFDRNKAITDGIINELRKEVDRLKAQVRELTRALHEERAEKQAVQQLLREMTVTANALRHHIRVLETQLNGG